jgi:hypothetical protein
VRNGVDGLLLPNEPQRWIEAIAALAQDESPLLARLKAGVQERVREATGG